MQAKTKILKWSLIVGILVVLNLFFNYSISLFYKEPAFEDYFPRQQVVERITTREACLEVGGQWFEPNDTPSYQYGKTAPIPAENYSKDGMTRCDPSFTKQKEFELAQKNYNRNIFIMLVALGVISLLLGAFAANAIVSLGFSWGGVLSLIVASVRYWSTADNLIKVLILAAALGALIWLAIKKFKE